MFVRLGRPRDAIAQYQAALQYAPKDTQTWMNLGVAFGESGDILRARDAFSRALSMGRSDAADAVRHCNRLLAGAGDGGQ
jgi:Flp pilus assembly protein TadD